MSGAMKSPGIACAMNIHRQPSRPTELAVERMGPTVSPEMTPPAGAPVWKSVTAMPYARPGKNSARASPPRPH